MILGRELRDELGRTAPGRDALRLLERAHAARSERERRHLERAARRAAARHYRALQNERRARGRRR